MDNDGEEFKRYRDIGRSLLTKGYLQKSETSPHEGDNVDINPEVVNDTFRGQNFGMDNLQRQKFPHHKTIVNERNIICQNQNENQVEDIYNDESRDGKLFNQYSQMNNFNSHFDRLNMSYRSGNNSPHFQTESASSTHDDLERKRKELLRLNKSIDLVNKSLKEKEQKVLSKVDVEIPEKPHSTYLTSMNNMSNYKYSDITSPSYINSKMQGKNEFNKKKEEANKSKKEVLKVPSGIQDTKGKNSKTNDEAVSDQQINVKDNDSPGASEDVRTVQDQDTEDEQKAYRDNNAETEKSEKDNFNLDDFRGLSDEATVRLQKAKLTVLNKQLKQLIEEKREWLKTKTDLEQNYKNACDEKRKLNAKLKLVEEKYEKEARIKAEKETSSAENKAAVSSLEKELNSCRKALRKLDSELQTKEIRLTRALEENEKLKVSVTKEKDDTKLLRNNHKKEVEKLHIDIKRLERQRSDLIAGFKKQTRLIGVLKKQRAHMEAAKLLSFTEDEFTKALDWNGN